MNISDENKKKIIDLYLNSRLTYTQILESVLPDGEATLDDLISVLKEYQTSVGHEIKRSNFRSSVKNNNKIIKNEDIFNMVENGFTDSEILDFYKKKGCSITKQGIWIRKNRVYKNKGLPIPNVLKERNMKKRQQNELDKKREQELKEQKKNELSQMIYSLRESKLGFRKIRDELSKNGINLNEKTIEKRYLQYCKENGIEPIKLKSGPHIPININKEDVYKLRQDGNSIKKMAKIFDVSYSTMLKICRSVYKEKKEEMPVLINKINISKQELMVLKEMGFSIDEIADFYRRNDIDVSNKTVAKRLHKVYLEQNKKMPVAKRKNKTGKIDLQNVDKAVLKKLIEKMRKTKNATDEQINELYQYYGIEIKEKEIEEK